MPVTKSAKKKFRQDIKREERNELIIVALKKLIKKARKAPSVDAIREAVIHADKAAKRKVIHKNKASRIKSSLSKLIPSQKTEPPKKTASTKRKTKPQAAA